MLTEAEIRQKLAQINIEINDKYSTLLRPQALAQIQILITGLAAAPITSPSVEPSLQESSSDGVDDSDILLDMWQAAGNYFGLSDGVGSAKRTAASVGVVNPTPAQAIVEGDESVMDASLLCKFVDSYNQIKKQGKAATVIFFGLLSNSKVNLVDSINDAIGYVSTTTEPRLSFKKYIRVAWATDRDHEKRSLYSMFYSLLNYWEVEYAADSDTYPVAEQAGCFTTDSFEFILKCIYPEFKPNNFESWLDCCKTNVNAEKQATFICFALYCAVRYKNDSELNRIITKLKSEIESSFESCAYLPIVTAYIDRLLSSTTGIESLEGFRSVIIDKIKMLFKGRIGYRALVPGKRSMIQRLCRVNEGSLIVSAVKEYMQVSSGDVSFLYSLYNDLAQLHDDLKIAERELENFIGELLAEIHKLLNDMNRVIEVGEVDKLYSFYNDRTLIAKLREYGYSLDIHHADKLTQQIFSLFLQLPRVTKESALDLLGHACPDRDSFLRVWSECKKASSHITSEEIEQVEEAFAARARELVKKRELTFREDKPWQQNILVFLKENSWITKGLTTEDERADFADVLFRLFQDVAKLETRPSRIRPLLAMVRELNLPNCAALPALKAYDDFLSAHKAKAEEAIGAVKKKITSLKAERTQSANDRAKAMEALVTEMENFCMKFFDEGVFAPTEFFAFVEAAHRTRAGPAAEHRGLMSMVPGVNLFHTTESATLSGELLAKAVAVVDGLPALSYG